MRGEIRQRIDEYGYHELLLAAMIVGIARVENVRLYLTNAELCVEDGKGFKRFDLPVDLAGFPIMAEFPESAATALHNALQIKLAPAPPIRPDEEI